jgi:cobalamin-dependent methionine synthase I
MILVGENLSFSSKEVELALIERDPAPIINIAKAENTIDIDYLDLNIRPACEAADQMMPWLIRIVQEFTPKPLSLDTSSPFAMEAGLRVCKNKALINSISLRSDTLRIGLPLVSQYGVDMVGFLHGDDGIPRDAYERCVLAVDLIEKANEQGITNSKIWIDISATPVSGDLSQLRTSFEFLSLLEEIAPGCKSIVNLSRVSLGALFELRPYLNRTYLMMLMKYGLDAAIVDAFDAELIDIARGRKPELLSLVHQMMDGEVPDMASLSAEELIYSRTVRIVNGESVQTKLSV